MVNLEISSRKYVTTPGARNAEFNLALKLHNDNTLTINGKSIHYMELKLKNVINIYKMKSSNLVCETKWERIYKRTFKWDKIWQSQIKSKASLKAKQLHWKMLHHAIFTEHKLNLIGYSDGLCTFCKSQRETVIHLFWSCINAKAIWESIIPVIESLAINTLNYEILDAEMICLLGTDFYPIKCKLINTIIMETKWFIWNRRNTYKHEKRILPKVQVSRSLKQSIKGQLKWQNESSLFTEIKKYFV